MQMYMYYVASLNKMKMTILNNGSGKIISVKVSKCYAFLP